jgi:hypothetical protein
MKFKSLTSGTTANVASVLIGGRTTTSGSPVSTGYGVSLTVKNSGHVIGQSVQDAFLTAGATRMNFQLFYSTVSIPAAGSAPNGGDIGGKVSLLDAAATVMSATFPNLLYVTGATGTFFVYLAFYVGNAADTLNLDQGILIVQEI